MPLTAAAPRAGVSLLEVLMSIFILTVGLLGMASLIPVGSYQVGEAIKADRAAAVGRAAFHEVRMRGLLDPRMWRDVDVTDVNFDEKVREITQNFFVIDPLGEDQNGGFKEIFENRDPRRLIQLRRWRDDDQEMTEALKKHIFTAHDDLLFQPRKNPDDPPTQVFLPADSTQKRASADQYSWLVTVVPAGGKKADDPNQGEMHRVSVAVFYARKPIDDPERTPVVDAWINVEDGSGSLPYDSLELTVSNDEEERLKQLRLVKEDRWIFVTGTAGSNQNFEQEFYRWYRVVSRRGNSVTVDGPEIGGINNDSLRVVLFKNVVGVYEHSMKLGGSSLWTN